MVDEFFRQVTAGNVGKKKIRHLGLKLLSKLFLESLNFIRATRGNDFLEVSFRFQ